MDGTNGVCRWEYESLGTGRGYGPYQLSGTLTIGWWALVRNAEISRGYQNLWLNYPRKKSVIRVHPSRPGSKQHGPAQGSPYHSQAIRERTFRAHGEPSGAACFAEAQGRMRRGRTRTAIENISPLFAVVQGLDRLVRVVTLVLLLLASSADAQRMAGRASSPDAVTDSVWKQTVAVMLADSLWRDKYNYDAGHFLMVPLHAAFQEQNPTWTKQFSSNFARFLASGFQSPITESAPIVGRLQYLYLASRFIALAHRQGRYEAVPEGLEDRVLQLVDSIWRFYPRDRSTPPPGMKNTVASFLQHPTNRVSDIPRFVFAIAADLNGIQYPTSTASARARLSQIVQSGREVFQSRVSRESDGRWLFQRGLWANHPDFLYAGNTAIKPGMRRKPVPTIGEDVSHSHRMPLWLTSLAESFAPGSPDRCYFERLRVGLAKQFTTAVLVQPDSTFPVYRTRNYMDGTNGPYRWEYRTLGPGRGYGPYQLSGTLTIGWWAFLGDSSVTNVYRTLASEFPLPTTVLRVYTLGSGTGGSTEVNAVVRQRFSNGLLHLISILASDLQAPATTCRSS